MRKIILKQPYNLTVAKYKISVHAQRVLFKIIECLQPDVMYSIPDDTYMLQDKTVEISTKDLLPDGNKNYSLVKNALKELRKIDITIKDVSSKSEIYTGFITEARYCLNNSKVQVQISKNILPKYLILAHGYTKYSLASAFQLSSPYSMRMYMRICHWVDKNLVYISLNDLREFLKIENKYPQSAHFKNFVLLPAQKELKEKADVYFSIKNHRKEGRKVIGWNFYIHKKEDTNPKKAPLRELPPKSLSEAEQKLFDRLTAKFRLAPRQASKVVNFFGTTTEENRRKINQKLYDTSLRLINKLRPVENIGGYIADWFNREFEEVLKI